ncbi:MAG: Sensory histidine kinase [Candidatus Tokpelaia sp. JSC188]|nr:MAG: Sensory histidine kinase [Candidatus Tokpelaia sp. JSC188]
MAAPYAFLDILANPQVRDAYLSGEISIILSADLATVLWSNRHGAHFMGFRTILESINVDSGFDRLTCLQIEAGLLSKSEVRIRGITKAQSFLVNVVMIEQLGEVVFLHSVSASMKQNSLIDLIDDLNDVSIETALLDLSGRVIRASSDFHLSLFLEGELFKLLEKMHKSAQVKKRFFLKKNNLPIDFLQLRDRSPIFLLIMAKLDAQKNSTFLIRDFIFDIQKLPLHFFWKIDAEGKFTEISPELREVVGPEYANIVGFSFVELAEKWQMDRDGAVRTLLKSRNAWSGRSLFWPVQGEAIRVDIELAALPVYSHAWVFSGFRGFGKIRSVVKITTEEAINAYHILAGRLSPQEHEAFSMIARQIKADISAITGEKRSKESETDSGLSLKNEVKNNVDELVAGEAIENNINITHQGALSPLNQLPIAVLVYRDDRILFINLAFIEISGYSSFADLRQDEVLAEVLQVWIPQSALHTVSSHSVPVEIFIQPVIWEDGRSANMISFIRREAPQLLNKTEIDALQYKSIQLATLLNMVSDGVIILDKAEIIVSVNDATLRIFDYSPDHMKGKPFRCFFSDSEKNLERILFNFQSTNEENQYKISNGYKIDGITAHGEIRKLHINLGRMKFDDGFFLIIRDLTRFHMIENDIAKERNYAQEILRKQSRYLAFINHEVKTSLNAIISISQLMLEGKDEHLFNDRYRNYLNYLKNIIRSSEYIATLINNLLRHLKCEEGNPQY